MQGSISDDTGTVEMLSGRFIFLVGRAAATCAKTECTYHNWQGGQHEKARRPLNECSSEDEPFQFGNQQQKSWTGSTLSWKMGMYCSAPLTLQTRSEKAQPKPSPVSEENEYQLCIFCTIRNTRNFAIRSEACRRTQRCSAFASAAR